MEPYAQGRLIDWWNTVLPGSNRPLSNRESDRIYSDHIHYHFTKEKHNMASTKAQQVVRSNLAGRIFDSLDEDGGAPIVLKVWEPEPDVGPYGGEQFKMLLAVDDGEEVHGALVVVYCDEKITNMLQERVEKAVVVKSLRAQIADL